MIGTDPDSGDPLFNNGISNQWSGGLSLQYSMRYLQTQVKDLGLPEFVNKLTPVVEVAWSSPASSPSQSSTQYLFGVGVNYTAQSYALSVEALIPGNRQTGSHAGVIAQFHLYFDDLFPNSLGKPIVDWFNDAPGNPPCAGDVRPWHRRHARMRFWNARVPPVGSELADAAAVRLC